MKYIDVFNGDADGICALHQLRLVNPVDSTLLTGVKRDISLLKQVTAEEGDQITVLDISLDKNREELQRLLAIGSKVDYIDHHFSGEIPKHPNLMTIINTSNNTCTSLLVNQHLKEKYPLWAAVGAYGDNLHDSARISVQSQCLTDEQLNLLCELGTLLNYNGYGAEVSELIFPPDELYSIVKRYENPFDFISSEPAFQQLQNGYHQDIAMASALKPELEEEQIALYMLPDTAWARRVSGVFGNQLARNSPSRAHALLTKQKGGTYLVSVRAPLNNKEGADILCRSFPTGGGRKAAAGINRLPEESLNQFVEKFKTTFHSP